MTRLLRSISAALSSRATSPLVIGFFLLIYIGIAFITDETLITLMSFTRSVVFLIIMLALLPLNSLCRLVAETRRYLKGRRAMAGRGTDVPPGLFDETVTLAASSSSAGSLPVPGPQSSIPHGASSSFNGLESRLGSEGYKTSRSENVLAAWRGVSIFPARIVYLAGTFCLFAGILISLTTRTTFRGAIVEGEPLPLQYGSGGLVERITLEKASGSILDKKLSIQVAGSDSGEGGKTFGIYPPSRYKGAFVYPRYLGVSLLVRFSAPDVPASETRSILNIYPPGKEAVTAIPASPYRISFSLVNPDDGTNPYMTGRMVFRFKVLKDKEAIFAGTAPSGGEFAQEGYRIALPDARRLVITDFVRDYGVHLIWTAGMLFVVAAGIWLPVRFVFPRREMLFLSGPDAVSAGSRAEGKVRRHGGVFHEALDFLEARKSERAPSA